MAGIAGSPSSVASGPVLYRPRRPARTLLHRVTCENLETYLAGGERGGGKFEPVPFHIEAAFRNYLKCGVLVHGFCRAYCSGCGHDFLIAFSCKGRDICPSCATRRMVETAAHLVDDVLPRVRMRQWVLSVPKRVRWHLRHKHRLAQLITPPRIHKHRYCGVLAPNAKLRRAVIESAGPAGATLHVLQEAQRKMGLDEADSSEEEPKSRLGRAAARCWALLLARIYECLPLQCPSCGQPMRIIAFVLEPPVIERVLRHVGDPTEPPAILPARSPPQGEIVCDQDGGRDDWPEMDQSVESPGDSWD